MTIDSSAIWIALLAGALLVVIAFLWLRGRRHPSGDHGKIIEDVAREAVSAYEAQQQEQKNFDAAQRRERAARGRETKQKRIEGLKEWREPFVQFVRRLAEPFFIAYSVDPLQLDDWAEERADVYISKKPYVLDIVRSIHADAQRAAERLSSKRTKSAGEIARERVRGASRKLVRNSECPYCCAALEDGNDHLDHIRPVNRGGPTIDWNMVFVCVPCNRAKRDLSLSEFIETDYARRKGLQIGEVLARLDTLGKYVDMSPDSGAKPR